MTNHFDKVYRARRKENKIRNPNIEFRNKPKDLNSNDEVRNGPVWRFLIFDHLKMFRISDFEFRVCSFCSLCQDLFDPFDNLGRLFNHFFGDLG